MNPGLFIASAAAFLTLCLAGAGTYFYNQAIARGEKAVLTRSDDLPEDVRGGGRFSDDADWLAFRQPEHITLTSRDGLALAARFLPSPSGSAGFAVLAHGYTANGSMMGRLARMYSEELGWNVLIPDARGHGESDGRYIGFGWHDRLDYLDWIGCLRGRFGDGIAIVLHGVSMGGATVLMTAGEPLPAAVKCVVSDCAYTSAWDVLSYQLSRLYRLPPFPAMQLAELMTRLRAGYSLKEASALEQVRKARVPILFIHGDEDTFVPYRMAGELYAAAPVEKELFTVTGAGHGNAVWTDSEGYTETVTRFVKKHAADTSRP